jgi:hypothetical protein
MDSPLVPKGRSARDDDQEGVVGAPAPEIVVPRAIPVVTGTTERFAAYVAR